MAKCRIFAQIDAWLPTAIGFGITGAALGATYVAVYWPALENRPGVPAVLGGFVAAGVAIALWGLTYLREECRRIDERESLKRALWTESLSVMDMCLREAIWWRELPQDRLLDTPRRIVVHMEAGVFEANLDVIGKLPIDAADALLEMRGRLKPLGEGMATYYRLGDDIRSGELRITREEAIRMSRENANVISDKLMAAASSARRAGIRLDKERKFQEERRNYLSSNDRSKLDDYEKMANAEIDAFEAKYGAGG